MRSAIAENQRVSVSPLTKGRCRGCVAKSAKCSLLCRVVRRGIRKAWYDKGLGKVAAERSAQFEWLGRVGERLGRALGGVSERVRGAAERLDGQRRLIGAVNQVE